MQQQPNTCDKYIQLSHLNVGGWTTNNHALREAIICKSSSSIFCVNETHLSGTNTLEIEGYTYYAHNRKRTHIRAPKTFGGVGVFVKNCLFSNYDIKIYDKGQEDIMGIMFTDKHTDYSFLIISCYLPPENSPYVMLCLSSTI